jgi:AcrR family transcriptional regulator
MSVGATPAAQSRSKDKRDRLIHALDELLREKPFDAITIADIARAAGVSPATIYQRFNRKNAAVSILIELYMRKVREWTRSAEGRVDLDAARGLRDALRLVAESAWDQVESFGYVMRPAYLHSRLQPDLVGPTWNRLQSAAIGGFRAFLDRFSGDIPGKKAGAAPVMDLDHAAASLAAFYNMMLLAPLLHPGLGGTAFADREAFSNEMASYAYHYLTAERRPGDDRP